MLKRVLIASAAGLLVVGCYFWAREPAVHWSGSFELQIHVKSEVPIRTLRVMKVLRHEDAGLILMSWPQSDLGPWTAWDDASAKPLRLRIPTVGSDAASGRELAYAQDRAIIVDGEFVDGRPIRRAFEIPDGRQKRELEIVLRP
jgi:hypothetical protein